MQTLLKKRRNNLINFAKQIDCDVLVAFEPENIFYITGFWGHAIVILMNTLEVIIITSELEEHRAKTESIDCNVIKSNEPNLISTLIPKIKNNKVCTDCKDYSTMTYLRTVLTIRQSSMSFFNSRAIKDRNEISILKKASKMIDDMFDMCINKIELGQRELDLQTILMSNAMRNEMFDAGYKFTMQPLIIASGPNSSFPHSQVTQRKFSNGDLIVIDLTLRYKGYVSDATRTFGIGKVSDKAKKIYLIVRESQNEGLKKIQNNVSCSYIDNICRNYIKSSGYEKYFIHSTGHGIGLDIHEPPIISKNNKSKLKNNMTITIEPGIYIPTKFGVRIEDSIIIGTENVILHKFTKDFIIL